MTYYSGPVKKVQLEDALGRPLVVDRAVNEKGRPKNEEDLRTTLSAEVVARIRERIWNEGTPRADIAAEYGLSLPSVTNICTGKTWKDAGGPTGRVKGVRKINPLEIQSEDDYLRGLSMARPEVSFLVGGLNDFGEEVINPETIPLLKSEVGGLSSGVSLSVSRPQMSEPQLRRQQGKPRSLTLEQVEEIQTRSKLGPYKVADLAKEYGVSMVVIYKVLRGAYYHTC